jgi:hypothetical protein
VRQNGEICWFALACVDLFVSRAGAPGFDKRDAWDNKVHSTIWRLVGRASQTAVWMLDEAPE